MNERDAIVAWLRAEEDRANERHLVVAGTLRTCLAWEALTLAQVASEIELGAHLAQGIETREGGDAKTGPVRQHESPVPKGCAQDRAEPTEWR